ncbi:MAG: TetR/AcrR family transcriptional regulator [Hyphomicrobiales bacterium]
MAAAAAEKRQQLIEAAAGLFHRRGVAGTTIADVAEEAGIALGSVFYYFKTKDDLVAAVAERRQGILTNLIARREQQGTPHERLASLIEVWISDREVDALYGCPIGSFYFELARARGPLAPLAVEPFRELLQWCERQFRDMGVTDGANRHALHLVSSLQGISLVAAVFADPEMILREANHQQGWLNEIGLRRAQDRRKAG